ncbi:hypothetical protein [Teredinibacter sp. KSP-S5-2]|uniref:hypothetical protein n=1 Tax=Teredinibacter sp. KSP-S5-2 TaxID=3034506 RepID=UPI002934A45A|nr:hypothetical protein [Teredinibacter sp. KSP-S5-2]WNO10076.1 hypothetical protein P5V12_02710 [Teredinibacter sp. KSP-S5-2]
MIPMSINGWSEIDVLQHWGYELYDLLDHYTLRFLLTGLIESKCGQGYIRAFRAVRNRDSVHFDDVLVVSPWNVRGWTPIEAVEYVLSPASQAVYDYQFEIDNRLPEFSVSSEDLSVWMFETLEKEVPVNYESKYRLYTEVEST